MRCISHSIVILILFISSSFAQAEHFPRPNELARDIDFWKRVYTEIDTNTGFIHDSRNLSIVYETLPARGGYSPNRSKVKKVKAKYKKILSKLASGRRSGLTAEEQRVLDLWGKDVSTKRLQQAAHNIRFQLGQSDRFRAGYIRSGEWRPYIDQTLKVMGLPAQIAVLPHVESSFNPEAYSKVGAAGMWQFIRSTGKRYMQIDYVVDERMDPFAATIAAAKLLQHNYSVIKSWPLALTAYNHGLASMRRAVKKLGTTDITKIAREYNGRAFGFASRNFYVAFVAALEVDRDAAKHFGAVQKAKPFEYTTITMPYYLLASSVSESLAVDTNTLQRHNRSLMAPVWNGTKRIPKGFELRVPKTQLKQNFNQLLASIPADLQFTEQTPDLFHRVERGDTMSVIARRYGYSVRELMAANGITNRHLIRAGQKLRLPVKDKVVVAKAEPKPKQQTIAPIAKVEPKKPTVESTEVIATAENLESDSSPAVKELAPEPATISNTEIASIEVNNSSLTETLDSDVEQEVESVAQPDTTVEYQASLLSDPSDYTVAEDSTIEVQASETLGHYAEWLDLRASQLRKINNMRFGKPVVVGRRIKLDFSRVTREQFEQSRVVYQKTLQEEFFTLYRIGSTYQHKIKRGESLWVLALRNFKVPIWLLRQHNPDVDFDKVLPGTEIVVPELIEVANEQEAPLAT